MWSSFTLTSADPLEEVRGQLAAAVTADSPFFLGCVWHERFEITRRLSGVRRTVPILARGRFERTADGGTIVNVRTSPRAIGIIAALIALGTLAIGFFTSPRDPADWFKPWFFAGCEVLICFIMFVATAIEERFCRDELLRILASAPARV